MRVWGECEAIYRLLVPPPVTVQWRGYAQTLCVRRNPYPPYGVIEVLIDRKGVWADHFSSGLHAEHVLRDGWRVLVPSLTGTLMVRLMSEGLAELVAGPHKLAGIGSVPRSERLRFLGLDARYTYRGPDGRMGELL